jgi:hypothetical protein
LIDIGPSNQWLCLCPGTFTSDICEAETVSLETLIKRKMLVSRKSRLQLGVQLAMAIMQLRMTGWLGAAWGKQDIFFLVHKDLQRRGADGKFYPEPIIDKPFVRRSFGQPGPLEDSSFQTHCRPDYDPTVFWLGIVLLELSMEQTIESLAADYNALCQHNSSPYNAIAKLLIGEINEKDGLDYGSALSCCVGMGIAATGDDLSFPSRRTLENPKFRSEILHFRHSKTTTR